MSFKPDGYTSLAPYLIVADAQKTLNFLNAIFGSTPLRTHNGPDGSIMHTEVRVDDTVVMIGQTAQSVPAHVHIYVPDVDATFQRAVDAGGQVFQKPAVKDDPDRRCAVADPNGIVWWFATQVKAPQ